MKKTLILTPNSYPYGKGDAFLETEINYLVEVFDQIHIFPSLKDGPKRSVPPIVTVHDTFIVSESGSLKVNKTRSLVYILSQSWFWMEIISIWKKGKLSKDNLLRLFRFAKNGYRKFLVLDKFVKDKEINTSSLKLYSYWYVAHSLALTLFRKKYPESKGLTRTHEYDLYEKGNHNLPLRNYIADGLQYIIPISTDGVRYLKSQYNINGNKVKQFNLGVESTFLIQEKDYRTNQIKLMSVAFLSERKRIPLVARALVTLSKIHPKLALEWIHIGGGNEAILLEIQEIISLLPDNFKVHLAGNFTNAQIFEFYQDNRDVDAFINVSTSEGKPVSIMEAQSFGIPVIATNVGGMAEIVNNKNGYLLSPNPSEEEVAMAIYNLLDINNRKEKSKKAYQTWQEQYNAKENYRAFANFLVDLN